MQAPITIQTVTGLQKKLYIEIYRLPKHIYAICYDQGLQKIFIDKYDKNIDLKFQKP